MRLNIFFGVQLLLLSEPAFNQVHPKRAAKGQELIVEVVTWVVQHAGASSMAHFAVHAIAIADEKIGARHLFKHEGEVLCTHGGFLNLQMVGTRHLFDHLLQEVGLFGVVDGGG